MNEFNLQKKYNWELAHKPIAETSCSEQPYRTGIFDDFPWYVTPTMVPTCNKVIDTPAFPTALPVNLTGYKVIGSLDMLGTIFGPGVSTPLTEYIGSIEISGPTGFQLFPWKSEGTILAYDDNYGEVLSSAFACGARVTDPSTGLTVPADYVSIMLVPYASTSYDLFLVINAPIPVMTAQVVSFEYSFFAEERDDVKFIIY